MTETLSPRFGFTVWGDSTTDGPSMAEFNGAFAALESLAAKDTQGVFAARPAAGEAQRYYYATDTGALYRDNGSAWTVVGSTLIDAVAKSSANAAVPLVINAATGQTADLFRAQVNAVTKASIDKDGNVTAGKFAGLNADFTSIEPATRGLRVTGAAAQTADLIAARNNAGTYLFTVDKDGHIDGAYFASGTDQALIGGSGYTTLANQTLFTGTAALEVRSTKGGTGAYQDALVIRHPQFTNTAVTRRLGVLLKLGDEIPGDVSKAGGIYLESTAADAATPSLVLHRADAAALTIPNTGNATLHGKGLSTEDTNVVTKTGAASLSFNGTRLFGAQGNSGYDRIASGSWYWYAAGVHSDTPGDAGAGGFTAASLTAAGLFTTARLIASSTAGVTLAEAAPAFMVGASNAANVIASRTAVQARDNGAAAKLLLNPSNGDIDLGSASSVVNVLGTFKIASNRISISAAAPGSPATNDIWIDV